MILIQSTDDKAYLWPAWYYHFNKWIGDCNERVVFASETSEIHVNPSDYPVEPMLSGKGTWGQRMHRLLDKCDDLIWYMHEDFWLKGPVNHTVRSMLERWIKAEGLSLIKACGAWCGCLCRPKLSDTAIDGLKLYRPENEYLISHQVSLWRREFLRETIDKGYRPWDHEINGTADVRRRGIPVHAWTGPQPFPYRESMKGNRMRPGGSWMLQEAMDELGGYQVEMPFQDFEATLNPIGQYAHWASYLEQFSWESFYDQILKMLTANVQFSFARYTDGEWSAIWKRPGCNADGHPYYPEMGDALANVLKSNPPYHCGIQWLIMKQDGPVVCEWITKNGAKRQWYPGEVLHEASKEMGLRGFVEAMRGRRIIVVGNESLEALPFKKTLIQIPRQNVWLSKDAIVARILAEIGAGITNPVILYSASMAAEVMIDEVYNAVGNTVTQIDCGSIWDPYIGDSTRRYHAKMQVSIDDLSPRTHA